MRLTLDARDKGRTMSKLTLPCALILALSAATVAQAFAPDATPRPLSRGQGVAEKVAASWVQVRPQSRTQATIDQVLATLKSRQAEGVALYQPPEEQAATSAVPVSLSLVASSARPTLRPPAVVQKAMARRREAREGSLAGIRGVQGEVVGAVAGPGGCGIPQAYRVTKVSGVTLTQGSLMDKQTIQALKNWIEDGLNRAVGNRGGGVASLRVAAHYACRTRNHQPGARLSEHAKGKAIDFSGFTLRNGEYISVLDDWGRGANGRILREAHRRACGPFGTVLGPESDRFHRDHFHFDTARHRGGPYCR